MFTYPNQKVITVFKKEYKQDFLQIGIDDWQRAANELTYNAFKMYLYFASNKNGYTFALSYEAINNRMSMHRNTYDKCIKELITKGYLRQTVKNHWMFNVN